MRQTQVESNDEHSGSRNIRRPAITFAAGLLALAIATAVVIDQPGGRPSAGNDATVSSLVNPAMATADVNASTTSAIDATKPRFERSDEPAVEDSTNAHGG